MATQYRENDLLPESLFQPSRSVELQYLNTLLTISLPQRHIVLHCNLLRDCTKERIILKCLGIILILIGLGASPLLAVYPLQKTGNAVLGVKIGMISRASFQTDTDSSQTTIGSSFGAFADFPVVAGFRTGFSFDFHNIIVLGKSNFLFDGGLVLKYDKPFPRFALSVRPALGLGVGFLPDMSFMPQSHYVTLKAFVEVYTHFARKRALLLEIGVWHTLAGGFSNVDIELGPALLLRIGYVP